MVSCVVSGCRGRSSHRIKGVKFYSFPKNPQLQKRWIKFCDPPKTLNLRTARICSRHFEEKFYYKRTIDIALGLSCPTRFRNLVDNAVPTLNGPNEASFIIDETTEMNEGEEGNKASEETAEMQTNSSSSSLSGSGLPDQRIFMLQPQQCTTTSYEILKNSAWGKTDGNVLILPKVKEKQSSGLAEKCLLLTEQNQKLKSDLTLLRVNSAATVRRLQERIAVIEGKNKTLEIENRTLKNDKLLLEDKFKKHTILLKQYFSTGQLRRMFCDDPNKRLRWTAEDISSAISLKCENSKAYDFLRSKLSFLLPDPSTLRRWIRKKNTFLENKEFSDSAQPVSENDVAIKNLLLLNDQSEEPIEADENDADNDDVNIFEDDVIVLT